MSFQHKKCPAVKKCPDNDVGNKQMKISAPAVSLPGLEASSGAVASPSPQKLKLMNVKDRTRFAGLFLGMKLAICQFSAVVGQAG